MPRLITKLPATSLQFDRRQKTNLFHIKETTGFPFSLDIVHSSPSADRQPASAFAAQQALIAPRLARPQNIVTFCKVLGGGWTDRTMLATAPG
ncbi:hypothetical protein [Belnapia rosea]|uniref:hypothetical protein n=1 Tax=Belnapia rosea TaxID=938405 RepID=UPI0015A22A43|nr:hypothetical protein [Belnapia rosea]